MMFALSELLSTATPVEIGGAITLAGAAVGAAWKISRALSGHATALSKHAAESQKSITELTHQLDLFKLAMTQKLTTIEERSGSRLTRAEFRGWIHELRAANPTLKIPMLEREDEGIT